MMMTASLKKTQKAHAPAKLGTLPEQKHWQLQYSSRAESTASRTPAIAGTPATAETQATPGKTAKQQECLQ